MFWKNSEENGPLAENDKTDRATELCRKTKGKTGRLHDSAEIPDKRVTSDITGLSLEGGGERQTGRHRENDIGKNSAHTSSSVGTQKDSRQR